MTDRANILDIVRGTTVDGPGFRTSIYFAGCIHHCPGCHNPQSWDFDSGTPMSIDELMDVIKEEDFDVTLSGGDPMYQMNFLIPLCKRIKEEGYNIWIYTGFTIEELAEDEQFHQLSEFVDTIVDSPFIEELRNPDLLFRGSSNQRIINLHDKN